MIQPSILSKVVKEIVENSLYLSEEDKAQLREVVGLPEVVNDGKPVQLRALVTKMMKSLEIQASTITGSQDPRDHKLIIDGYDKLIKMLVKNNESIDQQERSQKIEEALVRALEKTAEEHDLPEIKTTFLRILEEMK